jgi:hypothetical protein
MCSADRSWPSFVPSGIVSGPLTLIAWPSLLVVFWSVLSFALVALSLEHEASKGTASSMAWSRVTPRGYVGDGPDFDQFVMVSCRLADWLLEDAA